MPAPEIDFTAVTTGYTGKIARKYRSRRRTYIIVVGRDDRRKPVVLKIGLGSGHRPQDFCVGRDIRITEMIGKLGRELVLAFPVKIA